MKTIKTLVLTSLVALLLSTTAFADVFTDPIQDIYKSIYSPVRPGIEFFENHPGLSYPSFNNFTKNPNIPSDSRGYGDERLFLLGKLCPAGICPTGENNPQNIYYNTIQTPNLTENDKVRFELYFHNNGSDPFKDTNKDTYAENVRIGVRLNNQIDPNNASILRPNGYITANNNEYRTNTNDPNTIIKQVNGQIERVARDDMQVKRENGFLYLKPVEGSAKLWLNLDVEDNGTVHSVYNAPITGVTTLNFVTATGTNYTTTVTPHYSGMEMWLEFSELPGCFRFSGFAYFDAVAVEPDTPFCEDLTLTEPVPTVQIDGKTAYELRNTISFKDGNIPAGTSITYKSDDPNAKFYKISPTTLAFEEQSVNRTATGTTFYEPFNQNPRIVYYVGEGTVEMTTRTNIDNLWGDCVSTFTPPPIIEEPICKEIKVNHDKPILERTLSKFESKSFDTDGNTFDEQITYTVDTGYGFFSTQKCEGVEENPRSESIEWSKATSSVSKSQLFNGQLLQTNTLAALTSAQKDQILQNAGILSSPLTKTGQPLEIKTYDLNNITISKKPIINLTTLQDACNGSTELTVNQGDPVYFYAFKHSNGQNVIHLKTNNTNVNACDRDFPITIKPIIIEPVCQDLSLITTPTTVNGQDAYAIKPNITFNPNLIPSSQALGAITLVWETSDPNGKFYLEENGALVQYSSPLTQNVQTFNISGRGIAYDFNQVLYTGAERIDVTTYDKDSKVFGPCIADLEFEPVIEELVCENLDVLDWKEILMPDYLISMEPGHYYTLSSRTKYSSFYPERQSTFTSNSGMFLIVPDAGSENGAPNIVTNKTYINTYQKIAERILEGGFTKAEGDSLNILSSSATVDDESTVIFITYSNASETDKGLTVKATDRNEEECEKSFPLTEDLICVELVTINWEEPFFPVRLNSPLKAGEMYELTDNVKYNKFEKHQSTTYTTLSGVFVVVPSSENLSQLPSTLRDNVLINTYRKVANRLKESGIDSSNPANLPKTVTVLDGDTVFLVTFVDAKTTTTALTVSAVGRDELTCKQVFSLEEKIIPPPTQECLDLEIVKPTSLRNWSLDQEFRVELTTNPNSYKDDLRIKWEVSPSNSGDWKEGETTSSFTNTLENIDEEDEPRVTITAVDKNGQEISACRDTAKLIFEDVEPEIKKYVYDTKKEDWRTQINIGGKATDDEGNWLNRWLDKDFRYVNYLIEFEPGSADSAEIWEKMLENGVIESQNLKGELTYKEMAIAVEPDGNQDPYIIYQTNGFDEDLFNDEKIGSDSLSDYDNFGDDINDLEDKYFCEDARSSVVCIANDFNDIEDDFKDGKKLVFGNLKNAERIFIIFQTENDTVITDQKCKELETTEGCGEIFDNTINFGASRQPLDSDFELYSQDYDGDDSAEVIVICPYILTRQGGDVFFKDVLDTGVDVEYCSKSKNTDIIITEKPDDDGEITSTGTGDNIEDIIYQTPTHDVCKLSNTEDGQLAEFRNVLKNFSSSICEMQAEVAENWKEENINKAIETNINKIARYGRVSGNVVLNSMNDIVNKGFTNTQSGVFIVENGNLTIGNGFQDYIISSSGKIPAAQTYIVKGGTLEIKSNIRYNDKNVNPANPASFPSVAFIVIDGDIKISNDVTELNGIYMAVNGVFNNIQNLPTFENMLTVNGSLVGDVYQLFLSRRAIGDPQKDEGSITVKYDQRIILNTPPGLGELMDVNQLRVAN